MRGRFLYRNAAPRALALSAALAAPALAAIEPVALPDLDARANLRDLPPATTPAPTPLSRDDARPLAFDLSSASLRRDEGKPRLETPAALDRRLTGDVALAETLRLEYGGIGLDPTRPDALGRGSLVLNRPTGDASQQRLNLVDVALSWDALPADHDTPFTLSLLGGVRALHYGARGADPGAEESGELAFDPRAESGLAAAPLAGVRLRWDMPGGLYFRTGTAWGVSTNADPRDLSLSADLGYEVTRRLDVSLGYERTRAAMGASAFEANVRQDFIFARISLRF